MAKPNDTKHKPEKPISELTDKEFEELQHKVVAESEARRKREQERRLAANQAMVTEFGAVLSDSIINLLAPDHTDSSECSDMNMYNGWNFASKGSCTRCMLLELKSGNGYPKNQIISFELSIDSEEQ